MNREILFPQTSTFNIPCSLFNIPRDPKILSMQNSFFIRTNNKYERIDLSKVLYLESCGNYARFFTENKRYVLLVTLKQLERELPPHLFCRIHRCYIVSLDRITAFDRETVFLDQVEIPLGYQYRDEFYKKVRILGEEAGKRNLPVIKAVVKKISATG